MKKHTLFAIACILAAWPTALPAQAKFIPLNVDYAVFNGSGETAYLEVYFSIPQNSLRYEQRDSVWVANFTASITITNGRQIVFQRMQPLINTLASLEVITPYSELRHVFACQLPPAHYSGTLQVTDQNASVSGEYQLDLQVKPQPDQVLSLSDIQLAASIRKSTTESYFNKGGIMVVPNPSGIYHIAMPMLYYYAEAHHLAYDTANPGTYTLEAEITDMDGKRVRQLQTQKKNKPGSSVVLVGGRNIITLSSAPHVLRLRLTDDQTGEQVKSSKRFTLFKPSETQIEQVRSVTSRLMQSYYEKYSEEDLDDEFAKTGYISGKDEKSVYDGLKGVPPKAEFLAEFWRLRDSDKDTPQNEFKIGYFQKVEFATRQFSTKFKEGWQTDRGRVLLTYGQPDEIERSPMQSNTRPYEIWSYFTLESGSIFVFGDLQGFGDYELLHATYRTEIYQPDWQRRLQIVRENTNTIPDE